MFQAVMLCLASTVLIAQDSTKPVIPKDMPPAIRVEIEKVQSAELPKRLEGAFNLGAMSDKAAPAIPFLIAVLHENEGLVDVEQGLMKYFEEDAAFLVFGGKAATINPVQMVASDALVKIGKPALGPLRVLLATDPLELPYAYAVGIMARMQDPETTQALIALLADQNRLVRSRVVRALAYSKSPAAIDALIGALSDSETHVRDAAANSLKRITGQSFGTDVKKWKEWQAKSKGGEE